MEVEKVTEFYVDNIAEPVFGMQVGPGVINAHPPSKCAGDNCVIHNPSDHHMRSWPTNWRSDRQMMERTCPHGVGHPDPDDINPDTSHGCDGCCRG